MNYEFKNSERLRNFKLFARELSVKTKVACLPIGMQALKLLRRLNSLCEFYKILTKKRLSNVENGVVISVP
jgi:hypothetical protein